jgi:nitrite reductase/ring-hydroxylating ferredoxin subunit
MLRTPYSAYLFRDMPGEDAELTHVGPGTPGGEYLRRFWQPVALSAELDDRPLRVRIMGEDLVVFRDRGGRVGLLQMRCSHRGTSLEFGIVAARGLRCCYHGWLFDVDGTILETPGEPAESTLKDRLHHGACPVREHGGMVFAYLGPPDRRPPFPLFDMYDLPGYRRLAPKKHFVPCNWVQMKENQMDPVHTVFLHTIVSGGQFTPEFGQIGHVDWMETPLGTIYIHVRRVGDNLWIRMAENILPNMNQYPPTWENGRVAGSISRAEGTLWSVPVDDTHTMNIGFRSLSPSAQALPDEVTADREQVFARSYEEQQRAPGDYEAQVSQGPITIHALEHLGATDRGVLLFRRLLRQGIRAVQQGEDPKGVVRGREGCVPTYTNDTVVRAPRGATTAEEAAIARDTGRRIAEEYVRNGVPTGAVSEGEPRSPRPGRNR